MTIGRTVRRAIGDSLALALDCRLLAGGLGGRAGGGGVGDLAAARGEESVARLP